MKTFLLLDHSQSRYAIFQTASENPSGEVERLFGGMDWHRARSIPDAVRIVKEGLKEWKYVDYDVFFKAPKPRNPQRDDGLRFAYRAMPDSVRIVADETSGTSALTADPFRTAWEALAQMPTMPDDENTFV